MFAYRHAFHAGNHADVLKHLVLVQVLRYMAAKGKPYRFIDTHAGAGGYSLKSAEARKNGEYEQGIARLWSRKDLPPAVAEYVDLVRGFNTSGRLSRYPGSPALTQMLLQPADQLRLFELHPSDFRLLSQNVAPGKQVQIAAADGFAALKGQVPPSMRRAVVLMDPSYEIVSDYTKVLAALRDALARFAEGVYLVWYPQVQRVESAQLAHRLKALAPKSWVHVRMTVQPYGPDGFGLAGSGMFVFNPPYTLAQTLREVMPWLTEALAQYDGAGYLVEDHAV